MYLLYRLCITVLWFPMVKKIAVHKIFSLQKKKRNLKTKNQFYLIILLFSIYLVHTNHPFKKCNVMYSPRYCNHLRLYFNIQYPICSLWNTASQFINENILSDRNGLYHYNLLVYGLMSNPIWNYRLGFSNFFLFKCSEYLHIFAQTSRDRDTEFCLEKIVNTSSEWFC